MFTVSHCPPLFSWHRLENLEKEWVGGSQSLTKRRSQSAGVDPDSIIGILYEPSLFMQVSYQHIVGCSQQSSPTKPGTFKTDIVIFLAHPTYN